MTNQGAMPAYRLGDEVEWTSQAAGISKAKRGLVVGVVKAGLRPSRIDFPSLYSGNGIGLSRDHESYVVRVKGRGLYWPRTSALKKAADALLAALSDQPTRQEDAQP